MARGRRGSTGARGGRGAAAALTTATAATTFPSDEIPPIATSTRRSSRVSNSVTVSATSARGRGRGRKSSVATTSAAATDMYFDDYDDLLVDDCSLPLAPFKRTSKENPGSSKYLDQLMKMGMGNEVSSTSEETSAPGTSKKDVQVAARNGQQKTSGSDEFKTPSTSRIRPQIRTQLNEAGPSAVSQYSTAAGTQVSSTSQFISNNILKIVEPDNSSPLRYLRNNYLRESDEEVEEEDSFEEDEFSSVATHVEKSATSSSEKTVLLDAASAPVSSAVPVSSANPPENTDDVFAELHGFAWAASPGTSNHTSKRIKVSETVSSPAHRSGLSSIREIKPVDLRQKFEEESESVNLSTMDDIADLSTIEDIADVTPADISALAPVEQQQLPAPPTTPLQNMSTSMNGFTEQLASRNAKQPMPMQSTPVVTSRAVQLHSTSALKTESAVKDDDEFSFEDMEEFDQIVFSQLKSATDVVAPAAQQPTPEPVVQVKEKVENTDEFAHLLEDDIDYDNLPLTAPSASKSPDEFNIESLLNDDIDFNNLPLTVPHAPRSPPLPQPETMTLYRLKRKPLSTSDIFSTLTSLNEIKAMLRKNGYGDEEETTVVKEQQHQQ